MNKTYEEARETYIKLNKDILSRISEIKSKIPVETKIVEESEKAMGEALDNADTDAYKLAENRKNEACRTIDILERAIKVESAKMENPELAASMIKRIQAERVELEEKTNDEIKNLFLSIIKLARGKRLELDLLTEAEKIYAGKIAKDNRMISYYPSSIISDMFFMDNRLSVKSNEWKEASENIQKDIHETATQELSKWNVGI